MNNWCISGHLGRDPELRETANGEQVLNMRVAIPNRVKRGSEWVDEAMWVTVTVFGKRALGLSKILKKGRLIEASGELRLREWEGRDGGHKLDVECIASRCDPLGKGDGAAGDAGPRSDRDQPARGRTAPARAPAGDAGDYDTPPDDDDDIPF